MPTRRRILIGTVCLLAAPGVRAQDPAKAVRRVSPGERIATGPDAELFVVAGRDAMLVRRNSSVEVLKDGFRLITGAVLAVFEPKQRKTLRTPTATIGIRGTAVYLEVEPRRTYACTCYGEAVLEPADEPSARETVRTRAHEQPRYILPRGTPQMLMAAPVLNHTDAELRVLESLL